jgi:hypothetical protein
LTSSSFLASGSWWVTGWGNIPILFNTGPRTTGIFLTKASVARRVVYFLAHFLISFLSLLNFLRLSRVVTSTSRFYAATSSACFWSAIKQILIFGLGMFGSLTEPTNLLSFYGS